MEQRQDVLNDYRQASGEQRLAMFLTHRSLREEFQELDLELPCPTTPEALPVGPLIKKWMVSFFDFRLVVQLEKGRPQNSG